MTEPTTPDEDEAFNEIERQAQQRMKAVKAAIDQPDRRYVSGWNSALELAAFELEYKFKSAFGKDTLQSIAIYIRGMKK